MVRPFTSAICAGEYGYGSVKASVINARQNVKMFFQRYSEADSSMLLMTRRPSATTEGMDAKLESSSTIWDA